MDLSGADFRLNSKPTQKEDKMRGDWRTVVASLVAVFFLAAVSALGASGGKVQVKGMIVARAGDTMIVNSPQGRVTVVLTDTTRTKDDTGIFGLSKKYMANTVLIPGLKVKVDGSSAAEGRVIARTITVDGDDLETAEMIQAGLHPTAEQVAANVETLEAHHEKLASHEQGIAANKEDIAANKQEIELHTQKIQANMNDIQGNTERFTALGEYNVRGEATVKFAVGSAKISPADMDQLKHLAESTHGISGYIVEVTGYADSTGGAAMNTNLSEARAKAVITYLVQQGRVPIRHIVAPGAMGEYGAAAPNESRSGRAENRRVEVKILVNKGISGN